MTAPGPRIETRTSGIWQTNSVVLSSAGEVLVVDPAFFPRELDELAALARSRGRRVSVAFTHGHWDHVAGWRHFPGARICGSESLAAAVSEGRPQARTNLDQLREFDERWYVPRSAPVAWPPRVDPLRDGERLAVGPTQLEALALPGHSDDGLALWLEAEGLLLPGDYLSSCEIPFVEDLPAYRRSLERVRGLLPRLRRVIPGHGPELDRAAAGAILDADTEYLDALARLAERGEAEAALGLALPRAAVVPGMAEWHRNEHAPRGGRLVLSARAALTCTGLARAWAAFRHDSLRSPAAIRSAAAIGVLLTLALSGCGGGGSGPAGPSGPKPGGTISGRYTLEIQPAAACNGRTVSFAVEVTQSGSTPHPGSQLLLAGAADPALLELELEYVDNTLEGGIGTTGDGYPSIEGPQVWVNAIASGRTTQTSDARGEVTSGTLRGYVEIEGVTDACTSTGHAFTLRAK
jgi:hydroxyacylglutathione hydrolase